MKLRYSVCCGIKGSNTWSVFVTENLGSSVVRMKTRLIPQTFTVVEKILLTNKLKAVTSGCQRRPSWSWSQISSGGGRQQIKTQTADGFFRHFSLNTRPWSRRLQLLCRRDAEPRTRSSASRQRRWWLLSSCDSLFTCCASRFMSTQTCGTTQERDSA